VLHLPGLGLRVNPKATECDAQKVPRRCRTPDRARSAASDEMDSSRDSNGIEVPELPCAPDTPGEEESKMKSTTIAVDLAKAVFEVAVS
jgi:hypothetical protein